MKENYKETLTEKILGKLIIKKLKPTINKLQNDKNWLQDQKNKEKIKIMIKNLMKIGELQDNGKTITEADLDQYTQEELTELLQTAIQEFK